MSKHSTNSKYSRKSLAVATAVLTLLGSMQLASASAAEPEPEFVLALGGSPSGLTVLGNQVLFSFNDGILGTELWKTDGTAAGTVLVKDIRNGSANSSPGSLTFFKGEILFAANDDGTSPKLWKSDGTSEGTVRAIPDGALPDGVSANEPTDLTVVGDTLYFLANFNGDLDTSIASADLFKFDETGASLMASLTRPLNQNWNLTAVGETLFFTAGTVNAFELWASNGSPGGTGLVRNIGGAGSSSLPDGLTALGNTLYFAATDADGDRELWRSGGTSETTTRVLDINGSGSSSPANLAAVGNTLFFAANDGTNGVELWKTNATTTTMVRNIEEDAGSSNPTSLTAVGDTLFFLATTAASGQELWISDGTVSGTEEVKDILPGPGGSVARQFIAIGNSLYFSADNGINGREPWVSDGTPDGTRMIADLRVGSSESDPRSFRLVGNSIIFYTQASAIRGALWRINLAGASTPGGSSGGSSASAPVVLPGSVNPSTVVNLRRLSTDKVSLPAKVRSELRDSVRSMTTVSQAVCTGYTSNSGAAPFTVKQARERAVRACNIVKRLQPAAEVRTRVVVVDDAKLPRLRSVRVVLNGN